MADTVDLATLFSFRAPSDAIAYLAGKRLDDSVWHWFDVAAEAHARSFTVAKAMRMDVLQAIHQHLLAAMQGEGQAQFIRELTPELQRLGWWGKQVVEQPDGTAALVTTGTPRRLRTIFRTNASSAYNTARYRAQLADAESRPFWQYVAVMDARTRPTHAALHGRVFRFDDPIWRWLYPPNDYGCRCRVRALTARELERRGLKVESGADALREVEVEVGFRPEDGEVVTMPSVVWTGTDRAGRPISVAPHPGFASNPALVPWQPDLDRYDYRIARWFVRESLQGPAFALAWQRAAQVARDALARNPRMTIEDLRASTPAGILRGDSFAVAVLSPADRKLLGVTTQTVLLSDDTMLKQALHRQGQDFALDEYWQVQPTIEQADRILLNADQGNAWLYFATRKGLHVAVLKRTVRGEIYLQSFRRSSEADFRWHSRQKRFQRVR